jgi:hypothetical protein
MCETIQLTGISMFVIIVIIISGPSSTVQEKGRNLGGLIGSLATGAGSFRHTELSLCLGRGTRPASRHAAHLVLVSLQGRQQLRAGLLLYLLCHNDLLRVATTLCQRHISQQYQKRGYDISLISDRGMSKHSCLI